MKPLFPISLLAATIALSACNSSDDDNNGGGNGGGSEPMPFNGSLQLVDRHASGVFDEGASEIVAYHARSHSAYVTNSDAGHLDQIDLSSLGTEPAATPYSIADLESIPFAYPNIAEPNGSDPIDLGGANSVAVYGDLMAIAIEADDKQDRGVVAFYQLDATGVGTLIDTVLVGALPDMVTFSPDGTLVLVANEGEPSDNYVIDPEGSVTIIDIIDGVPADTGTHLDFNAFDNNIDPNVIVGNNPDPETITVSQDLEPEYITVSADSSTAFVSLQENNAIAIIDLTVPSVTDIFALGFKDYGLEANAVDIDRNDDAAVLIAHAGLYGRYQPDSIATYSVNDTHYIVTANEGDAREYIDDDILEEDCSATAQSDTRTNTTYLWDDECIVYKDEWRAKDLSDDEAPHSDATYSSDVQAIIDAEDSYEDIVVSGDLGWDTDTNEYTALYSFGARSFSIFSEDGTLVFDSEKDFEMITAQEYPEYFNSTDGETGIDSRSDDKGPEPEALAIGEVDGYTLAFIGLERMGGIMVYDITDPEDVVFVEYVNHRNYELEEPEVDGLESAGDLAPEGFKFVSAADSPNGNPLLLVANEVSGTMTVYQIVTE